MLPFILSYVAVAAVQYGFNTIIFKSIKYIALIIIVSQVVVYLERSRVMVGECAAKRQLMKKELRWRAGS